TATNGFAFSDTLQNYYEVISGALFAPRARGAPLKTTCANMYVYRSVRATQWYYGTTRKIASERSYFRFAGRLAMSLPGGQKKPLQGAVEGLKNTLAQVGGALTRLP